MKLADVKDEHGTSLQSYADCVLQKADAAGLMVVMLFIQPPDDLHYIGNVEMSVLPDSLSQLAKLMRQQPKGSASRNELREPGN